MGKLTIKTAMVLLLTVFMAAGAWAGPDGMDRDKKQSGGIGAAIAAIPLAELDETEEDDLLFMREEEKMARDVYDLFYATWGHWVFESIAESEQRHMDAILGLVVKYGLVDPVGDNGAGVFEDSDLQALYDKLTADGSGSLVAALQAGASIEETDILDLQKAVAATDNEDIQIAYQNLMKGSRNHLRAFVAQLALQGTVYVPQFVPQEEYDSIVNSAPERGPVDENGNPVDKNRGRAGGPGKGTGECPYDFMDDEQTEDTVY